MCSHFCDQEEKHIYEINNQRHLLWFERTHGNNENPNEHFENGDELYGIYDELKEKLSPELWELHRKFVDLVEGNCSEEADFYFVEGFKLGLLIGIECAEK